MPLHKVSYKPYRADFADATRAVLRLVERHSRHSTTALKTAVSHSRLSFSALPPPPAAAPLFRGRSLARGRKTRVLFSSALDATRRGAARLATPALSSHRLSSSSGTSLRSSLTRRPSTTLFLSLPPLSLLRGPATVHPLSRITRRNPLPCRLRPALLLARSRHHSHSLT